MDEPVLSLSVDQIADHRYRISDGLTHCYLFVGTEKALLLDTGFGKVAIDEAVKQITCLPLILVNTHSHADHTAGNCLFPDAEVYIQKEGVSRIRAARITALEQGAVFDLGGIQLEVVETPGHTPDSIILKDPGIHALFTGDTIELFHGGVRMLDEQIESVQKVISLREEYPALYPSHGPIPCRNAGEVDNLLECLQKIKEGSIEGKPLHLQLPPDIDIHTFEYDYNGINLNYNPELNPWA